MSLNPFYANIFIDSCAFDPKYEPEASAAEKIFELYKNEKVNLIVSHSNIKEAEHPNTPHHVKAEAMSKIYTIETNFVPDEGMKKQEIWNILTGDGKPEKMEQDANHVFEAHKYGGYFITTDGRILKKSKLLHSICNAHIVLPSQLLLLIEEHEPT